MKLRGSLKMISVAGCVVCCSLRAAADAVSAGAAIRDQVALLVSHSAYGDLKTELKRYKTDVEARFLVQLHIVDGAWGNPAEVRAAIKELYGKEKISGVILVGAVPMHRFFMHEHANPNPLYYEDFDLEFVDNDKNGVADAYKGKPQLKVWVANIRACEKAREDDIPGLRRFFSKTHDYYTGKAVPELRTLLFSAENSTPDWAGTGDWFRRRGGTRFSTPGDVTMLEGKACTHKAALEAFKKHSYSLTCVALHSDETGHAMVDEDLVAREIAELKTGSLITISHGCFAANWTRTEQENNGPNCALSWVFGKHLGQAVVAQVRSGGIGFDNLIYARLRAGDYLGKAYLPSKQAHELEASPGDHTPGDIVSGNLLIGNPFLRLKPVKSEFSRLVIKNAVYGDFENSAVTNVTPLLADWVDNNTLTVDIPNDDFGDPANGIVKQLKVDYTFDGKEKSKTVSDGETLKIKNGEGRVGVLEGERPREPSPIATPFGTQPLTTNPVITGVSTRVRTSARLCFSSRSGTGAARCTERQTKCTQKHSHEACEELK